MAMIGGDGNSLGAPAADERKGAAHAGNGEAMSKADDSAGADAGPLQAHGSRN